MIELLGLALRVGQVWGTVIVFNSTTNPKRLKYIIGAIQIVFAISTLGLSMEYK